MTKLETAAETWADLFDPMYMDHACEAIAGAMRDDRRSQAAMAATLRRHLLAPLDAYIGEHWKPGRRLANVEAANRLSEAGSGLAELLSHGHDFGANGSAEIGSLRTAWLEFIAHGAGPLVYDGLAEARKASAAGLEAARVASAERAAALADPEAPAAKLLKSNMQIWDVLDTARRDGTDPMQLLESRLQAKRASERSATARAFVLKEWAGHAAAYEFNKTQFAHDYRGRVLHEYGLKVSVRTIAERWLKG